jgi:acyl dehydratase
MTAPQVIDIPHILSHHWTATTSLQPTTTIAYNLALGTDGTHLAHVYEGHPSFAPLPTYATTFAIAAMSKVHASMATFLPDFQAHNHVHGSHWLRLHRPFPLEGKLTHRARVVSVKAVRAGVALAVEIVSTMENGEVLVTQQWTSIVLKVPTERIIPASSTSADDSTSAALAQAPSTFPKVAGVAEPTCTMSHQTTPFQAALYRAASGDLNPLHIDPETARKAGFEKPLLTGTCTLGVGVRLVMERFGELREVRECWGRLRRPVFAGEKVELEAWLLEEREREGQRVVLWRMFVVGDGEGKGTKVVVDEAGCLFERMGDGGEAKL